MEHQQQLAAQHAACKSSSKLCSSAYRWSRTGLACKWCMLSAELLCACLRRVPDEAPQEISDLIERCMLFDPNARPDAEECVSILTPFST